jgi:hypothetical protein
MQSNHFARKKSDIFADADNDANTRQMASAFQPVFRQSGD